MGVSSLWQQLAVSSVFVIMILCIERFIILTVGKLGIMGFFRYVLAFLMAGLFWVLLFLIKSFLKMMLR